ncbi:MAG: carbohydrate ABC transporter permease [Saccharospirillaceae bacterium]|nr:ABC transporter permease subunit [Pseudomonadales bacterium]NRB78937.1 carbohydrate ABC transporter permease [Saccharospirillaceae bacterium]
MNYLQKQWILTIYTTFFMLVIAYIVINPFFKYFELFIDWDQWQNTYVQLKYAQPYYINLYNSLKITILGTVIGVVVATLTAYSLAIYQFKFKNIIMILLLVMLMIPSIIQIVPFLISIQLAKQYLDFVQQIPVLSILADHHLVLILPYMVPAFGVFIIKQYLESILNKEMLEAARIEGATEGKIFRTLILPMLYPAIAIVALIQFSTIWNSYELSIYTIGDDESKPLAHVVRNVGRFFGQGGFEAQIMNNLLVIVPIIFLIILSGLILKFINADLSAPE